MNKNLNVIAYANGFTMWHYKSIDDTLETIMTENYFQPIYTLCATGDMVMVNGIDDNCILWLELNNGVIKTKKCNKEGGMVKLKLVKPKYNKAMVDAYKSNIMEIVEQIRRRACRLSDMADNIPEGIFQQDDVDLMKGVADRILDAIKILTEQN